MVPADRMNASDSPRRIGRFMDGATFGGFLRNHREGRNLSLHDLAAQTKIAERHLAALERGDIGSWPGGIYRRAMVRAYAAAVGLDPDVTVSDFALAFDEGRPEITPEPSQEPPWWRSLPAVRPATPVGIAVAICAVVILVFAWAARTSTESGAISEIRVEPVAAVGHHADAVPATRTSGIAHTSHAANLDTRETVSPAIEPQPTPPAPAASDAAPSPRHVEASLRIVSEPAGAQVTVNGIGWGQTPVTVRHLTPGEKRVRLSKDGYASAERRVAVTGERPAQDVRVTLAAHP
jgi:cytoskeleton protein RodZ